MLRFKRHSRLKIKNKKIVITNKIWSYLTAIEISVCIVAIFFFTTIFKEAHRYSLPIHIEDIPLIKKSTCSVRIAPDNPGGILISHQEKTIYNNLQYHTREQHQAEPDSTVVNEKNEIVTDSIRHDLTTIVPEMNEQSVFDIIALEPCIISLGTTGTLAAAETKWKRLKKQYQILKHHPPTIKEIKDKKGVRYKIQIQNDLNSDEAERVCAALSRDKEECTVE